MAIFDLYRSGYELGFTHGQAGERRRAQWEIVLCSPLTWLPLTDTSSFILGYHKGYDSGRTLLKIKQNP